MFTLGFSVVVPTPNALRIHAAHKAVDGFLRTRLQHAMSVRKTFDGVDAGLPAGQIFLTCTPYFLGARETEAAGPDPKAYLEETARKCATLATEAVGDVVTGVCWKGEGGPVAQGWCSCQGVGFSTQVRAHLAPIQGSYSALLQPELIALARAIPLNVLAMAFPHARQALLERALPVVAKGPGTSRL